MARNQQRSEPVSDAEFEEMPERISIAERLMLSIQVNYPSSPKEIRR